MTDDKRLEQVYIMQPGKSRGTSGEPWMQRDFASRHSVRRSVRKTEKTVTGPVAEKKTYSANQSVSITRAVTVSGSNGRTGMVITVI
jgi:hypothetical protein